MDERKDRTSPIVPQSFDQSGTADIRVVGRRSTGSQTIGGSACLLDPISGDSQHPTDPSAGNHTNHQRQDPHPTQRHHALAPAKFHFAVPLCCANIHVRTPSDSVV